MMIRTVLALAAIASVPVAAQLASPNRAGVAIGHLHINASDFGAQRHFWTQLGGGTVNQLGGIPVNNEKQVIIQFPGVYVILRPQVSTAGTVGSIINHVGFHVKNINESLPKWKAAGIKVESGNNPGEYYLIAPDNIRVEIIEDPSTPTTVAMHHIHLLVTDPLAVQAWYVKNFGATVGKRGQFDTANVPGAEITLTKSDVPQAPTKGRSVDHIGFAVENLDQLAKKLEAAGVQIEAPGIRNSTNFPNKLRVAYIYDPWGTYIELAEGSAGVPGI